MSDQTIHNVTSHDWVIIEWIGEHRTVSASAMTWLEWHEELLELRAERDALAAEIARLRRLEAALPKTADGVYVIPGSFVYHPSGTRGVVPGIRGNGPITLSGLGTTWACIGDCYSTSEAAEAARDAEKARKQ